jgi:hypothetical protein
MEIIPFSLKEANAFISENHRHHQPVRGHKFSIGCKANGIIHGVAIVGRPVARNIDYHKTLEVTRLCTDGYKNACSFLYSACARIAREMGYEKIITYILESESGTSLIASGWTKDKDVKFSSWDSPSRKRQIVIRDLFGDKIKYPQENKSRYIKLLK